MLTFIESQKVIIGGPVIKYATNGSRKVGFAMALTWAELRYDWCTTVLPISYCPFCGQELSLGGCANGKEKETGG